MLFLYRILSVILFPVIAVWLFLRCRSGKEDPLRLQERLGTASISRPQGEIIWIHAVSVGEANSAIALTEELLRDSDATILFTTTTVTSASILSEKIKKYQGRVLHQFLPVDCFFNVRNFLDFWQPKAALFIESEIWPNLIFESRRKGIPVFLINARMSEKSLKKWRRARLFGVKIFDYFTFIFAQSRQDQENFCKLTKQQIFHYGNLKSAIQELDCNENTLKLLQKQIQDRPIFLAASTHKGEEAQILNVDKNLRRDFGNLLTIIVPRHPNRAQEIKFLLRHRNFAQRSENQVLNGKTEIYLADTLGELGVFYKLADFAFIGGSLSKTGGHNPFEPIKLQCAVITGPHTFNFKEIYQDLVLNNSCLVAKDGFELEKIARNLLKNPEIARKQAGIAEKTIAQDGNEAAQKITKKVKDFLMI